MRCAVRWASISRWPCNISTISAMPCTVISASRWCRSVLSRRIWHRPFRPPSSLVLVSVIFMFAVAIPLGVITAHYRDRPLDHIGRILSLTGVTIPSFLFAITLQLLAARFVSGWPIIGRIDHALGWQGGPTGFLLIDGTLVGRFDVVLDALKHLALPALRSPWPASARSPASRVPR